MNIIPLFNIILLKKQKTKIHINKITKINMAYPLLESMQRKLLS